MHFLNLTFFLKQQTKRNEGSNMLNKISQHGVGHLAHSYMEKIKLIQERSNLSKFVIDREYLIVWWFKGLLSNLCVRYDWESQLTFKRI
jgi:hypothetical protein